MWAISPWLRLLLGLLLFIVGLGADLVAPARYRTISQAATKQIDGLDDLVSSFPALLSAIWGEAKR